MQITPDDVKMLCRALKAAGAAVGETSTDRHDLARRAHAVVLQVISPAPLDVNCPLALDGDRQTAREMGND